MAVDIHLKLQTIVLNFDKKMRFSENALVVIRRPIRFIFESAGQEIGDLSAQASRQPDQSLGIFFQYLFIDPRLVVKTFEVCDRNQFHQVFITPVIGCQEDEMIIRIRCNGGLVVVGMNAMPLFIEAAFWG